MFNLVKEREGFTLMELIVAFSLLGIVLIAVASIAFVSQRSLIAANRKARVQDEARYAMEHMVRNIRLGNEIEADTVDGDWVQVRMDWDPTIGYPISSPWDFSDDYEVQYKYNANKIEWRYRTPPWTATSPGTYSGWETIAKEVVNPTEPEPERPLFTIVGGPTSPTFLTIDLTARHDASSAPSITRNPEVTLHAGVTLRCKARD